MRLRSNPDYPFILQKKETGNSNKMFLGEKDIRQGGIMHVFNIPSYTIWDLQRLNVEYGTGWSGTVTLRPADERRAHT